jgi:hypothetical protein
VTRGASPVWGSAGIKRIAMESQNAALMRNMRLPS